MISTTTKRFRELLAALPDPAQRQAGAAYQLFRADPYHPSLHFKNISTNDPTIYSARIGLRYRVIGVREGDTVIWTWIGSHADYDRLVDQL